MSHPRIASLGILAMSSQLVLFIIAAAFSATVIILAILLDLLYLRVYHKFCNYYCCCPFQRLTDIDTVSLDGDV